MTAGVPGTGIGGMFYLVSALAMPLRQAYRSLRRRPSSGGWRVVAGQTAMAGAILAAIWVAGWLVGIAISASADILRPPQLLAGAHPGSVVRTAALVLSAATLAAVLLGVELLRLWVHRGTGSRQVRDAAKQVRRVAALVVLAAAADGTFTVAAQDTSALARRLARADSAFAAGDATTAAHEYAAALAVDPENSRATYRLADLSKRRDPARALRLFRRYVALEPDDPWGYMAVGDALARSGSYGDALRSYDDALRLAPGERDAVIGRVRVLARAGRTDAAVDGYRRWLAANPSDAEAWSELGRQRLRHGRERDAALAFERAQAIAPDPSVDRRLAVARAAAAAAITPLVSGTHDSDGNTTLRLGGTAELASSGPMRLGLTASRTTIEDGVTTTGRQDLSVGAAWRPGAALQVQASGGASRLDAALGRSATILPTGQLRARWRVPGAGPIVDLRARRDVLDATPLLAANRVLRTELGATVELPVARVFKLRGISRTVALSDSAQVNHRTTLAGMVAVPVMPSVEVSAQFHTIRFAHPTTAGYFAPRLVQVAQAGSYLEFETARGILLVFDIGAGVQRVAEQGAAIGPWGRALRLYSLIVVPLAVGRDLRLEIDGEQSAFANEVATTAEWRYVSAAMSLRWALH
jgi:tetratricopeptide (TPR) repeat protein